MTRHKLYLAVALLGLNLALLTVPRFASATEQQPLGHCGFCYDTNGGLVGCCQLDSHCTSGCCTSPSSCTF